MYGYDFHRQKPIDEYIVDFFCNKLQLAIECDGYSHEILEVYEKDVIKTKRLNNLGIHVLRFSDYQIMNDIENVLRAIEDYILKFEKTITHLPQSLLLGGKLNYEYIYSIIKRH